MTRQQHILVVGAGIIGSSIAFHLARDGARVTVVNAGQAGGFATPASFGWINASWGNPRHYFDLRRRSMTEWHRLAIEIPDIPLAWGGGLCFDLPPDRLDAYEAEHGAWGYPIRRVDRAEAARIEPALAEPPAVALHIPAEGAAEPAAAAVAMLDAAVRLGAEAQLPLSATALDIEGGRVRGIQTADGVIEADHVVLAAGIGTPGLAAAAGVKVPLEAPPGLLVHTQPHAPLLNGLVIGEKAHLRQSAEGRIVAGSDFAGTDPGIDPETTAAELFATAKRMLRGGERLRLAFHTIGTRPTPVDGMPIVGSAPGVEGLTLAVTHSGVTLAPAIGLFIAHELLGHRREPLLAPFRPERFAESD